MTTLTTAAIRDLSHSFKPIVIFGLLSICWLLMISSTVFSQTKYLRDNYWIENYSKKDGLPENVVVGITQDKKGFLWVTTSYKLTRFDGYRFKVFDPLKDFPDLVFFFAPDLIEDKDGIIWIASNGSGLFSFDPHLEKFNRFTAANSNLAGDHITSLVKDENGDLWVGTLSGLNRISKRNGMVHIKSFSSRYSEKLLNIVDSIVRNQSPEASHSRVGDLQLRKQMIDIKDSTNLLLVCMGEVGRGLFDYGWIENITGTVVWHNNPLKTFPAGGSPKNCLQIDVLTLPAGKYNVFYKSDEDYSWGKWNDLPPDRPDYWGIGLYKLTAHASDSIRLFVDNDLRKRPIIGSSIHNLLVDSHNNLWLSTGAALQKLQKADTLKSEAFALPADFTTVSNLAKYDEDHLIINGSVYDSKRRENLSSTLIIDIVTNNIDLTLNDHGLKPSNYFRIPPVIRDKRNFTWTGNLSLSNIDHSGIYISNDDDSLPKFRPLNISPPSAKQKFDQIFTMFEDRQGFIWVGSRQNGLYKIIPTPAPVNFTSVGRVGHDVSQTIFNEIFSDGSGNIWLSGANEIVKFDRKSETPAYFSSSGRDPNGALFFNGDGNRIFISEEGEFRVLDEIKNKLVPGAISMPDSLQLVGFDSFGNGWSRHKDRIDATSLFIYDGKKFIPVSFDSSNFFMGHYRDFHLGRGGNIWIAPAYDGIQLYRLNNETKTLVFVKEYLSFGTDVYDIYEQDGGVVWMGTYDGLVRLDLSTNSLKYLRKDKGLPSEWIVKIVPFKNKLWIIMDLGSAFLDTKDEIITVNKDLDDFIAQNIQIYYNDPSVGPSGDYAFYNWATRTSANEIAIVGKGGFFTFQPEAFFLDSVSPLLNIVKVSVNARELGLQQAEVASNFSLPHDRNDLAIEYVGIHFKNPSQNQYAYRLAGNNDEWVSVDHERVARYSNLSPGYYEFYLKAANSDGIWSKPQKMFAFTILPPWWQTWWAYASYILIGLTGIWAYVSYRSRVLKEENIRLEEKVTLRTNELNESLKDLKSAQAQLIQSEKMASLGELTAGIAHEIQNPLNFINNFSEVNIELLDEMRSAIENDDHDTAISISKDISGNEEKIKHHGSRADGIVKGMLQHSRTSRGVKEPSDINALADEYLRLSYHGMRAKDKSFTVNVNTNFDHHIGAIKVIRQDLGRVLLNLFNNSFYSVIEKKRSNNASYEPTVTVSTKKVADKVEVRIRDNGMGIPKHILEKIFQPFFTTKPPGQGTGLGLSLSYDMIVAHGGELKVNTEEGEYAEFIITLPI